MVEAVSDTIDTHHGGTACRQGPDSDLPRDPDKPLPQFKADRWGLPAILIMGLTMATISWQKWANIIVDYGQQLYIPWQLSEGKVLYRDLDYLFGPFSAYLHALLFRIFHPAVEVLTWFNLSLVAVFSFIIFKLFDYFADTLTASLTTLAFLGMFAFGQYEGGGNFNFICSYVHELPHGIILSSLALLFFMHHLENPSPGILAIIGFLSGCVYLTKPEVFLALISALAFAFFILNQKKSLPKNFMLLFLSTFLAAPLLAFAYFSIKVSSHDAVHYILLPWLHVFGSNISSLPMYQFIMGTDHLAENIQKIFLSFFIISGVCLGLLAVSRWSGNFISNTILLGGALSLVFLFFFLIWYESYPGLMFSHSLPLFILAGSIYTFSGITNLPPLEFKRSLGLLAYCIFSFLLLIKIFFNVRVVHYGFALALPATLVLIHFLTFEFPQFFTKKKCSPNILRPALTTLVMLTIATYIHFEYRIYGLKGQPVGNEGDVILDYHSFLDPRGTLINEAIAFIQNEIPEETSFAAIPSTIMLNFMTRRESSLKYMYLDPGALQIIGDHQIYADLNAAPPPYIVMSHQTFSQQGKKYFGKDFGAHIFRWIHDNYDLIRKFGPQPFKDKRFGIQIYKHNPKKIIPTALAEQAHPNSGKTDS